MTAIEYILDPRFEVICCALAVDNNDPIFFPRSSVANYLRNIKEPYAFISHNALFDAAILAYHYNIHPPVLVDTLSMCRALLSYTLRSLRLADVLHHFKLEAKGSTLKDVKGMRFEDIIQHNGLWDQFQSYNLRDVNGCREIFHRLSPQLPAREFRIMDTVIHMVTQPRLVLNWEKLNSYYSEVIAHKENLLSKLGYERDVYMSNDKFADLLRLQGVEPPMKISNTTGEEAYAFAKNDADFMALCDHPNEMVQQLMEARLGLKTTIEETRCARFINIATSTINSWGQSYLPVPLKYSGAHTHRLSGDWNLNMQNLGARKKRKLREAIEAPKGHFIIAIDAKQIEARLVAWLAGEKDLLDQFRQGRDTYREFAADIYKKKPEEITKVERFNAKTCILGLGFGMSDRKLLLSLRNGAREEGFDVEYTPKQTEEWVKAYRDHFPNIVDLWAFGRSILSAMIDKDHKGRANKWNIGPCKISGTSIILPSKLRLYYHNLNRNEETGEYWYMHAGRPKKIYGAKLVENVVQALDRQYVMDAAMNTETRCRREGIDGRIVLQLHDENVYLAAQKDAARLTRIAYEEMSRAPWWGLDFPAEAEVKVGRNYAELEELKIPKLIASVRKNAA